MSSILIEGKSFRTIRSVADRTLDTREVASSKLAWFIQNCARVAEWSRRQLKALVSSGARVRTPSRAFSPTWGVGAVGSALL
jgi:hypothetical protein